MWTVWRVIHFLEIYDKINMEIVWLFDLPCFRRKDPIDLQTNFTIKSP